MNSNDQRGDSFIWPYRDSSPVGPMGNGSDELREIERLYHARQATEIYVSNSPSRHYADGIVTDTLIHLEDMV